MAENFDVALCWVQQTQQQFHGRRFSRAVGAEQPKYLATMHLKIHVIDGPGLVTPPKIFEDFGQAADRDHDLACFSLSTRYRWLQNVQHKFSKQALLAPVQGLPCPISY